MFGIIYNYLKQKRGVKATRVDYISEYDEQNAALAESFAMQSPASVSIYDHLDALDKIFSLQDDVAELKDQLAALSIKLTTNNTKKVAKGGAK